MIDIYYFRGNATKTLGVSDAGYLITQFVIISSNTWGHYLGLSTFVCYKYTTTWYNLIVVLSLENDAHYLIVTAIIPSLS